MVAEESIHVSFKETNLLNPRKDNNEICILSDTLKKMNLDDLIKRKRMFNPLKSKNR